MKTKNEDLNVLFDSDMQPIKTLSPDEHRVRIMEELYKKSALRYLAPTRIEAINIVTGKLIKAKKLYDNWSSRQYVVNTKTIFTRNGTTTVFEANQRRKQSNLTRLKNEIDQHIRDLKLLGLSELEIYVLFK